MRVSPRWLSLASTLAAALLLIGRAGADDPPAHDAVTPVDRPEEGWQARHKAFNERVAMGDCDLILIGDSITQGWEGEGKDVWAKYYTPRKAVNLGIGGDRTQHVLWRLEHGNLEGITPKLAVLMIGTNNSGSNTAQEIADGVKAIVEELREHVPDTKVLVLGIFPRGENNDDPRRQVNQAANEIIATLADGEMVHYLDIGPKYLADDGTLSKEIMPDLLHLSPRGYEIWAEATEEKVKELMGE
jgi:lysophospholipase L1-like esterase